MTSPAILHSAIPGSDDVLRVTLDNGITVLARESYTSPAVVVDGFLPGGAIWEPRDKAGLSYFTGRLMDRGTRDYGFHELFDLIESNGASLEVDSGYHTYGFNTKSLAEDLPQMLSLLSQVLRFPTFPEEYVEKVRGQMLTELTMRQENTRAMASLRFRELLYPEDHAYGRSTRGYFDTVGNLTRDDVVNFHNHLGPKGMTIIVVGGIEPEQAVREVEAAFGDWENPHQLPPPTVDDVPAPTEIRQDKIDIPGKSQADVVLGFVGPRRDAPNYQAIRLANSIFGVFGMYGRLGDNVRERQGLAYYSFSRMRGGLGPNPWQVVAGVAPENVDLAVESIREEIRRMVDEPVTEEELSDNQSYATGSLVLGLETNDGVSDALRSIELYGLGLDYLHTYTDAINSVTIKDIQEAAQAYLNPDIYTLAVAGPPQAE